MEILTIFLVCAFSGVLTGLLGIGGGLVIVPAFLSVLPIFGVEFSIHQIIGISATCVFLNSATTVFYRRGENFLPKSMLTKLSAAIILGTLSGAYLSSFAPKSSILLIYLAVSLTSLIIINRDIYIEIKNGKLKFLLYLTFAFIGAISASIGIGGAILFATALKCFLDKDTKELLPTITFLVLVHAFFAFAGKFALGDVTLKIIPIALLASIVGSKLGIKISKGLSANTITKLMSAVLILAMVRVLFEFI